MMDIVERSMVTITKERYDFHVAEIERLRAELKSMNDLRHEAVCNLMTAGCDIGDLIEVLREVADAHGTGKQGAGSWLDKVHQALEAYE
jgi:uncharacterized protein (UPF0335 family)